MGVAAVPRRLPAAKDDQHRQRDAAGGGIQQSAGSPGVLARRRVCRAAPDERPEIAAGQSAAAAAEATAAVNQLRERLGCGHQADPEDAPIAWAGLSAIVTAIGGLLAKRRLDVGKPAAAPKAKGKGKGDSRRSLGSAARLR